MGKEMLSPRERPGREGRRDIRTRGDRSPCLTFFFLRLILDIAVPSKDACSFSFAFLIYAGLHGEAVGSFLPSTYLLVTVKEIKQAMNSCHLYLELGRHHISRH